MTDAAAVITECRTKLDELELTSTEHVIDNAQQLVTLMEQALTVLENKDSIAAISSFIDRLKQHIHEWRSYSLVHRLSGTHLRYLRMYKECFGRHLKAG